MRPETNPGAHVADTQSILRSILHLQDSDMPKRYQNPKLEKRTDVATPYWFIRVRVADPSKKKARSPLKLGFCHEMNQKEAMRKRADVLRTVNAGLLIVQARLKFREVVQQFETARIPHLGAAAASRYTSVIKNHILPAFGDRQLADIDRQSVEAWLSGKERDGLGWWSRWGLRGVLSAIFAAAHEWKLWTGDNPAAAVRIGKKKEVRDLSKKAPLTAEQLQSILAVVSPDTRVLILIAAFIGLRISEVLGLRWSDIDFEAGTLTVNRRWYRGDVDEPKNDPSKRRRELGPLLAEFSQRYPGPHKLDQYVFLGDDGVTPANERDILRYEVRPALKRLKLHYPGFGWHQFRRNEITLRQTVGGATAMEAKKGAGHSKMDTTLHYSLVDSNRERDQVQKMFDWLMGSAEGPKQ